MIIFSPGGAAKVTAMDEITRLEMAKRRDVSGVNPTKRTSLLPSVTSFKAAIGRVLLT